MEAISDTTWDVVLSGTGLPQSLLALALSRSGKKVLHVDKNDYYGGSEAALSLQEAEAWVENSRNGDPHSPFQHATIKLQEGGAANPSDNKKHNTKLGFSRAYSLSLSPQIIYTRSNLLPALVSSKIYQQLDFLAVGSWWLYYQGEEEIPHMKNVEPIAESCKGNLRKIPGGREDVFADTTINRRSMMSLMKFLKLAADPEAHAAAASEWNETPFFNYLDRQFQVPFELQEMLLALTSSSKPVKEVSTGEALPRIHRHINSIGMFGPGFGSVLPKWGGLSEIAQVACRAGAVGGGLYVLKKGVIAREPPDPNPNAESAHLDSSTKLSTVSLEGGNEVKTRWLVGSKWDLPLAHQDQSNTSENTRFVARSITIVSSTFSQLFPPPIEGAQSPAAAIVVFPIRAIRERSQDHTAPSLGSEPPPVYLMVHSSDTGECPTGQCVVYGHTFHPTYTEAHNLLGIALDRLLHLTNEDPPPQPLWSMHYDQAYDDPPTAKGSTSDLLIDKDLSNGILRLPELAPGLALEDDVLQSVRSAYRQIMGDDAGFMIFEERGGVGAAGDDDDE